MRILFRLLFLLVSLAESAGIASAQQEANSLALQTGASCPDFNLNNVEYFHKKNVGLVDFKGKWLVLDFWSKTCASCIAGFPKLNAMQKEFSGNVQFLLIGNNELKYNSGIKPMFERIRKYQNLDLPIAYDSLMFELFKVRSTPTLVVIDPGGIIRGLMTSGGLTTAYLKGLISGKQQDTIVKNDFVNSSSLSPWTNKVRPRPVHKIDEHVSDSRFTAVGTPLFRLYNLAYFGETDWSISDSVYTLYWKRPILELKDTTLFAKDLDRQIGYYNYDLSVPNGKANKKYLQFAMQCDLKKIFGYEVSVEKRMMPCWELKASDDALQKIRSNSNKLIVHSSDHSGFDASGLAMTDIIQTLYNSNQSGLPLFDETGIDYLIDVRIDADLTNFNDLRAALSGHGLKLTLRYREMAVIVIRDKSER